ncbi:MAG: 4Fe-4S dicluster domain-containing protein [Candidatus Marinimicrobia bacterium]|nr:4Fe-4S dicluster domain-containing protein [Candidatus Neomarinimicrobiota bacterium]
MSKVIKIDINSKQGLLDFLEHLLSNNEISGVMSLRKINENGICDYGLITEVDDLKSIEPFAPVMPVNASHILSSITPAKKPIIAIIKPCELRGFVERVKRKQGSMKNIITVSYTCGGVLPLNTFQSDDNEKIVSEYFETIKGTDTPENVRPVCKACEHFIPMTADITISVFGNKDFNSKSCLMMNTEQAIKLSKSYKCEIVEKKMDDKLMDEILKKRKAGKEKLYKEIAITKDGLDEFVDIFGKCIGCHGCSRVCPICYCTLCDFESSNYDYKVDLIENELSQKDGLRLPPDTIFFQLGRLNHMSFSCIGCGQCEDVCPAGIPVSSIFKKVGESTAELFDYIPGKDVEEIIPVMMIKEQEFPEVGE